MRERGKSTLLNMTFYGMIALMIGLIISLFIGVNNNPIATWTRIASMILSILLVLVVVYMVICMYSGMGVYPVGFALFILSAVVAIICLVYYINLTPATAIIDVANLNNFLFVGGNLVLINLLTIGIYITGLYIKQPQEVGTTTRSSASK